MGPKGGECQAGERGGQAAISSMCCISLAVPGVSETNLYQAYATKGMYWPM